MLARIAPSGHNTRIRPRNLEATPDQIDLHGMTVDEAIPLVDAFLHKAYKKRVNRVWVIHGKGTGALRREVRDFLTKHSLVARCSTAEKYRGGNGCTQVEMID